VKLVNFQTDIEKQLRLLEKGARLLRISLSPTQITQFNSYLEMLFTWNNQINLFSRWDTDRLSERHLLESLAWIPQLEQQFKSPIMDLGSGAGFPGIPLAIYRPDIKVVFVEAIKKKADFLNRVVNRLSLNSEVLTERVETLGSEISQQGYYPLIIARAVASLDLLLQWTRKILSSTGILIAFKGDVLAAELGRLQKKRSKDLKFDVDIIDYPLYRNLAALPEMIIKKLVMIRLNKTGVR